MDYTVKKTLLGKSRVHYYCPNCRGELESPLEEAGQEFPCPACQRKLKVPGEHELQRHRDDSAEQLRQANEAKQRETELKKAAERAAAANQAAEIKEQQRQKAVMPSAQAPPPAMPISQLSRLQGNAIIVLLSLIAAGVGFAPLGLKSLVRPQWEYRVESPADEDFERTINELGDSGWEFVFARRATHSEGDTTTANYEMIFKRQK